MEKLPGAVGDHVELDQVLMVVDEDRVSVGQPTVPGARVVAEVLGQVKDDKIVVFKYKRKTRYRRKNGHRQNVTQLAVRQIVTS